MSAEIKPEHDAIIEKAYYMWFTTVRADGTPQPTPIWFVREGNTILLYSKPDAQKVRNIRQNPHVALNFNIDEDGEDYIVIMGTAQIEENAPLSHQVPAFLAKYAEGAVRIGMTPESMAQAYSTAIRVTPTHIRKES